MYNLKLSWRSLQRDRFSMCASNAARSYIFEFRSQVRCFVPNVIFKVSACLLKMSSCTDPLGLNENKLFKDLKSSLPKITKETRNILEIRDDILYVWNADKCCILTLNITEVRGKNEDVPYQVRFFLTKS